MEGGYFQTMNVLFEHFIVKAKEGSCEGKSPMVKCMKLRHGRATLKHSVAKLYII